MSRHYLKLGLSFLLLVCTPVMAQVPLLLKTIINTQDTQTINFFLKMPEGIYAREKDIQQWNLVLPKKIHTLIYQNTTFILLSDLKNLQYNINYQQMIINLNIPVQYLKSQTLTTTASNLRHFDTPSPGAYFNYDINSQKITNSTLNTSGLFDVGLFNGEGAGTSGFLGQDSQTQQKWVRLNTTWTIDNPDKMQTIRLGDSFNTPGMWGRSVDFGGFQWSSNFNTQPSFISYPLPSAEGQAVVPSVVDLYVNNNLIEKQSVNPGPFSINNIPTISGQGNINIVTTDLLGRQQIISLPYYASTELLKPGLHDFSYEAGFIRNNFGINSNDYHDFMTTFTDNYGFTDNFTGQTHAEILSSEQTVGLGGNYLLAHYGIINSALAISRNPSCGELILLGFQHQSTHHINYGFNSEWFSPQFAQVGLPSNQLAPVSQNQLFAGYSFDNGASIGASFTAQHNRDNNPSINFVNLTYSKNIFHNTAVNISGLSNVGGEYNKAIYATLSVALGNQTSVNINADTSPTRSMQITRNLPIGNGYSYNLYAQQGNTNNYQGSVTAQNNVGTYNAQIAHQTDSTGYQAGVSGGIVLMDDNIYFSRKISNSFAVVQVPGYSNVSVYAYNQLIGKTNASGNLLVPNLLPYQDNDIKIEPNDLPLDAQTNITDIKVAPYTESGVMVKFPVQASSAAVLTVLHHNQPIPAGAIAYVNHAEPTYVANNGELYLTGLDKNKINPVEIRWDDSICHLNIIYPSTKKPLPYLGVFTC